MDILTAENAILSRLEDQIKSTLTSDFESPKFSSFPQDPTTYFENLSSQGEILVRFGGSTPSIPVPNRESIITQDLPIDWAIWIISPNLITHTGVYNWIEKVKEALTGWAVTEWADSTPMYCTNIQFIDEDGGIWFYEMTFQHVLKESEA